MAYLNIRTATERRAIEFQNLAATFASDARRFREQCNVNDAAVMSQGLAAENAAEARMRLEQLIGE